MASSANKSLIDGRDLPETYTFGGENIPPQGEADDMILLALSHTGVEHVLYKAMLRASQEESAPGMDGSSNNHNAFTVRELMRISGLNNYSTVRRGREGLLSKKSIERAEIKNGGGARTVYRIFSAPEIFSRRRAAGIRPYPEVMDSYTSRPAYGWAMKRLLEDYNLSRRESQVALACVKGLTNAEIGARLSISEQTVKFHLSHVFVKMGVKRRTELISRLLSQVS